MLVRFQLGLPKAGEWSVFLLPSYTIFCGYIVLTARDNEAQAAKAKKRLLEIVIGLALWVLAATLVQFFLPGADTTGLAVVVLNILL